MPRRTALQTIASRLAVMLLTLLAVPLFTPLAHGAVTLGFREHFAGVSLGGWGGGDNYSNPGTGGVLGGGDGFLMLSTPGPSPFFSANLGTQNSDLDYTGNWQAVGIKQVRFWLNDVGNADPLEIHFSIGDANAGNFWQDDTGFIPAHGVWTQFIVDLSSSAGFTHIINASGGTFDAALQNVNRVLIRHDLAPYAQNPDTIHADLGIDELLLTDAGGSAGVSPLGASVSRPLQLAPPYPNPSRGPVALSIESFEQAPITIQIVDVTGRVVRQASLASAAPGPRLWNWDGTTDAGGNAPAGVYRVRAFGPSGGTSRSLIRLAGAR